MPLDGRPARLRQMTDEEIDRVIMQGSPFAMPGLQPQPVPERRALPLADMLRGLLALAALFGAVAGFGVIVLG